MFGLVGGVRGLGVFGLCVRVLDNVHCWGVDADLADCLSQVRRVFVYENVVFAGTLFHGESPVLVNENFSPLFSHLSFFF